MNFLLLFLLTALSCNNSRKIEPTEFNSAKTDKHVNIPGTHIFIVPPTGFIFSKEVGGLIKSMADKHIASIQVIDKSGVAFTPLTKEGFAKNGHATISKFEHVTIDGYYGNYIETPNDVLLANASYVMFGDSSFSAYLIGSVVEGDSVTQAEVKKALQTVYYDKNKLIDDYETSTFKLNDSKTRFKLTKVMVGETFVYTIDGVKKDNYGVRHDNTFVATKIKGNSSDIKEMAEQVATKLKVAGATNIKVSKPLLEKIKDVTLSETEIQFQFEQDKILIYLAIADNGKHQIQFQGSVHNDFDESKRDFLTLTRSIIFND